MCQSKVFLEENGVEKKLMDDCVFLKVENGKVYIQDILNNKKVLKAEISHINFLNHKIYLKPL